MGDGNENILASHRNDTRGVYGPALRGACCFYRKIVMIMKGGAVYRNDSADNIASGP